MLHQQQLEPAELDSCDRYDLLAAESEQDTAADGGEDFADLDDLLADAVQVAEARKLAKKQGTKASAEVRAIIREADAEMSWEPVYAIARFVEQHCTCGGSHRRFDSWFIVSQHRREAGSKRFLRSDSHNGLPAWQYVAGEEVTDCAECLAEAALPFATIDQLMGVDALGEPAPCCIHCEGQSELELHDTPWLPLSEDEQAEEDWLEAEEAADDMQDKHLFEGIENV